MTDDLSKLRIDKSHKAKHVERSAWPRVVAIVVVLLLLIGGFFGWRMRADAATPIVQTIRVRVPDISEKRSALTMLSATGYVMAAHKIELASKVIGRVAWVGVEMGDKIDKNQELVRLEDEEFRSRVAQQQGILDNAKAQLAELEAGSRPQETAAAQARLDQSIAELTNSEISLKRLKDLESTNSVSRQQIDDADAMVRSRRAQVDGQRQQVELSKLGPRKEQIDAQRATVRQLEGALAMSMLDLNNTVIRSPVAATVLERNVEVGEFVTTGFVGDRGAKGYVVSIADLNDLRVELDVSQDNFAKVSLKQPCSIVTDAYRDKKYAGVVDLISPEANRQKATVEVRVKVMNPDSFLKPDMNATVSFLAPQNAATATTTTATATNSTGESATGSSETPAIRIPSSAVRNDAVFVVENGKALKRSVTINKSAGREVEVLKGLRGGEDLIVDPPATLIDGASVKVGP